MKLKYNHDGQTDEIQLYEAKPEGKSLAIHWDDMNYYAALVEPESSLASDIPIFYGEKFAVAKEKESIHMSIGDITVEGGSETLVFDGDYVLGAYETLDVDGTTNYKADICMRDGTKVGTVTTPSSYLTMKTFYNDGRCHYFKPRGYFNNGNPRASTAVAMNSTRGDYGVQKNSDGSAHFNDDNANDALLTAEYFVNISTIAANFYNSYVVGNARNNNIYISGGDKNLIVGGLGNDSIEFFDGGGVLCDYGIGEDRSADGLTYAKSVTQGQTSSYRAYNRFDQGSYLAGTTCLQIHGTVTGVYYNSKTSITAVDGTTRLSKKIGTMNVLIVYNSATANDNLILLPQINKKATTTHTSNPASRIWQTNAVALGTFKIYHGNGYSQISAADYRKDFETLPDNLKPKAAQLYQMYLNSNHVNKVIYDCANFFPEKFPDWS